MKITVRSQNKAPDLFYLSFYLLVLNERNKKMHLNGIIKWTNRIALFAIIFLVYWIFIFISITVFGFKVFPENITEIFYFSVMGILALLLGAIIVNIMFNLTIISQAIESKNPVSEKSHPGKYFIGFLISLPVIFGLLFWGDSRSSLKMEHRIKTAAQCLVEENESIINQFAEYTFNKTWLGKTESNLKLLQEIDENFPGVRVIIQDEIEGKKVFLGFSSYWYKKDETKIEFIYSTSSEEREYLSRVFAGDIESRFSASDGNYELYHPVKTESRTIVLYLSEHREYGKRSY